MTRVLIAPILGACFVAAGCSGTDSRQLKGSDGKGFRLVQDGDMARVTDPSGRTYLCTGGGDYARLDKEAARALFGARSADVVAIGRDAGYVCTPR